MHYLQLPVKHHHYKPNDSNKASITWNTLHIQHAFAAKIVHAFSHVLLMTFVLQKHNFQYLFDTTYKFLQYVLQVISVLALFPKMLTSANLRHSWLAEVILKCDLPLAKTTSCWAHKLASQQYTVFHKKAPLLFLLQLSRMVINLCEIFNRCSWRNINSKYFNKMWLLVKYSLLVVT